MLTRNQIEAELSLAYLQAIAAAETFAVDVPHIDSDSVDAIISGKGKIDVTSLRYSPRIEVQLKATINAQPNGQGNIPFDLTIKNYDDLRANTILPRLLILLTLPPQQVDWLLHHPDKLIIRDCCYYLNLKGQPASVNGGHQRVYIPTVNILTPSALRNLMIKASKLEDL
ncbi:DUF4365 domain-containing protein [Rurimicrobium arvi]|uniref:DUF4365 domain-containing protein n=1 Tax=Rurimicrobium arvi TaxID=2049916 RepID=A0ABP8MI10_9BACT